MMLVISHVLPKTTLFRHGQRLFSDHVAGFIFTARQKLMGSFYLHLNVPRNESCSNVQTDSCLTFPVYVVHISRFLSVRGSDQEN